MHPFAQCLLCVWQCSTTGMQVQQLLLTWLAQARPDIVLLHGIPFHTVNGSMKDIIIHVC